MPPGAVYACMIEAGGQRELTAIELAPKLATLCAKNPEMGPCQYEREICRARGGRVFAANGEEITRLTEAEYDRRVTRVKLRSN
jgi:hypothetical protein